MKLFYRKSALIDLQAFVDHYEEAFRLLYQDSGLWNEEEIISSYKASAETLFMKIFGEVDFRLKKENVLGRKSLGSGWYEIGFYVGQRFVAVLYSEDKRRDVRFVESVSIDRKPIIF